MARFYFEYYDNDYSTLPEVIYKGKNAVLFRTADWGEWFTLSLSREGEVIQEYLDKYEAYDFLVDNAPYDIVEQHFPDGIEDSDCYDDKW